MHGLGGCFEQFGQVHDAHCDLLHLMAHRATLLHLLELIALAPLFTVVCYREQIIIDFQQDACVGRWELLIRLEWSLL